jgi:hypothetical protein
MPLTSQNTPIAQQTASPYAWFILLTITEAGQPPLYLVNNNEPFVSRGVTYQPYAFGITLPADDGESLPKVSLSIDNISGDIVEYIRAIKDPPDIIAELVTSAYPDIVEKRLDFLKMRQVTYDAMTITGQLEVHNILSLAFPDEVYDPAHYPGLFR